MAENNGFIDISDEDFNKEVERRRKLAAVLKEQKKELEEEVAHLQHQVLVYQKLQLFSQIPPIIQLKVEKRV